VLTNPAPRHFLLRRTHRVALVLTACLAVLLGFMVSPSTSRADDSSTLTVVGTSDVSDSNLMAAVIKPGFEAFEASQGKTVTLNYVPLGTGAAIQFAENGTASALLVHAASLENQFVAGGFSAEKFGRAIFYGDYVLLGPPSDPAGVMSGGNPSHDIVSAFQKIAAAGAAGTANFVSRGGTPGTTVAEHAIWQQSTGVPLCVVSTANGGGSAPATATSSDCSTATLPPWYHTTGLSQGLNLANANTCNYPNSNCYVLTDRGTYKFLASGGTSGTTTNQLPNLQIVTRQNSPAAIGGPNLLVNSFHAYAISASKFAGNPNVQINSQGAEDFLNWLTSPPAQTAVGKFLNSQNDPPFLPDAAPALTASSPAKTVTGGKRLTIKGSLRNLVPGAPNLAGKRVTLLALRKSVVKQNPSALPVRVATTNTNGSGHYTFHYKPNASSRYTVSTGQITQVENNGLNPIYGDLLHATSTAAGSSKVKGAVSLLHVSTHGRVATVVGSLAPAPTNAFGHVSLYAERAGHHKFTFVGKRSVKAGRKSFTLRYTLASGFRGRVRLKYVDKGQINSGQSATRSVRVS
jgi:tungstate transport system substrate-binding protein